MRIAFVTHYCTHYRVKTYEVLSRYEDVDFYFYSAGKESYWDTAHGVRGGTFKHKYLPGFQVGRTRFAPSLGVELWRKNYSVYLKCINGKFALPLTYLMARLRRKPFVLWTGIWMRQQTLGHRLGWPLTRFIYRHADAIVTYGTHVNDFLVAEGVLSERIFAALHAVDNNEFDKAVPECDKDALRRKLRIEPVQKVVLFVGRLVEVKGLSCLLSAFSETANPDAVLVLAGQGPEEATLRQQAASLGIIDKVRFAGYVPTNKILAYYAIAWVHVLPSITTPLERETWGLVVNEAFNQGVPSIASSAVGAAAGGLVEDNETGFVTPERDSAALADRLRRILSDDALRNRLSCAAKARIATWDNEAMVSAFRDAIRYAVKRRGGR
jgi:glycosyltransferase involved in cell wall biosynthesis